MALLSLITEQSTVSCVPTIYLFLGDHFGVGIISGAVQTSNTQTSKLQTPWKMIEIVNAVLHEWIFIHVTAMRNRAPNFHSIVGLALWSYNTLLNHDERVTSLQHQSSFDSRPPRAEKFKPVTCLLNHCDRSFSSSKVEFIRVIVWSNEVSYMRNIWSILLIFPRGS